MLFRSDNVWAYQFMHNAPTALLDMLQAVSYTDTGFAVGADGSITLSGLKKGTQIGQIGRTGGNYGQHIHGEIKKGTTKDFINRFQLGTMWVTPNAKAYSGYSQAIDISTKAGIDEVMRGLGYIASCGTDSLQKSIQLSQFLSYYHLDNSQAVQSLISQYKPGEVPPYLQQYLYYVQLTEYWRAKLGR